MKILIKIDPQKLRYARLKKNLTLEGLGKKLGVTKSMVSIWERDVRKVAPKYHDRICKMLGVSLEDICKPTNPTKGVKVIKNTNKEVMSAEEIREACKELLSDMLKAAKKGQVCFNQNVIEIIKIGLEYKD